MNENCVPSLRPEYMGLIRGQLWPPECWPSRAVAWGMSGRRDGHTAHLEDSQKYLRRHLGDIRAHPGGLLCSHHLMRTDHLIHLICLIQVSNTVGRYLDVQWTNVKTEVQKCLKPLKDKLWVNEVWIQTQVWPFPNITLLLRMSQKNKRTWD